MTSASPLDEAKLEEFGRTVAGDLSGTLVMAMCSLGDRLGLFKELVAGGPATSEELARRAGISERYAREWISCLACAGYLEYRSEDRRFSLPPEHAAFLAQEGGPRFVGGTLQRLPLSWGAIEVVERAFRTGAGIPLDTYGPGIAEATERGTATWHDHKLIQQWIPAVPEVQAMFERGASVADVGSGSGRALIRLAEAFPESRYVGFDVFEPAVERAIASAEAAGVADRVRFEQRDINDGLPDRFDVVTTFDVIHDLPHPRETLAEIRKALKPGGAYLMLEINSADRLEDNFGARGAMRYGNSVFHCMSTSLGAGGEGLGTMGMPPSRVEEYCREAGFGSVSRVGVEDPMNVLYEIRL